MAYSPPWLSAYLAQNGRAPGSIDEWMGAQGKSAADASAEDKSQWYAAYQGQSIPDPVYGSQGLRAPTQNAGGEWTDPRFSGSSFATGMNPSDYLTYAHGTTAGKNLTADQLQSTYDPARGWIAPTSVTAPIQGEYDAIQKQKGNSGFWNGIGPWALGLSAFAAPVAASMGAASAGGGLEGTTGGGMWGNPQSWNMLAGDAPSSGMSVTGGSGMSGNFADSFLDVPSWDSLTGSVPIPNSDGGGLFGSIPNAQTFPNLPGNFSLPSNITPESAGTFGSGSIWDAASNATSSIPSWLRNLATSPNGSSIMKALGINPDNIFGSLLNKAGSTVPGALALNYAQNQTPIDTTQLQGVFDKASANGPLFTQAAQNPLLASQARGYGDIVQSQGARGIRGSSFGDADIANYMTTTNRGIADAGTNAAQAALGLQGNLGGQIANLNAASQAMKNNLFGRAFDVLGRGLNPAGYSGFGAATI